MNDAALRVAVDPAIANRFKIERQELKAVGIDAPKIRGAQGDRDEIGRFLRHFCRSQERASKINQRWMVNDNARQSAVNGNTRVGRRAAN